MRVAYSPTFKKQYQKLPPKLQQCFHERLDLFLVAPTSPQLRLHPLKGKYAGYWSINITGDLRAIHHQDAQEIYFVMIGTHSELYG